eukprot:3121847-Pleurochrysis_carterae.AAC.1
MSARRITHRDQVIKKRVQPRLEVPEAARGEELARGVEGTGCNQGGVNGSVRGGRESGVKGCNESAGDARSGAAESWSMSSRTRSPRSHAPARSAHERR